MRELPEPIRRLNHHFQLAEVVHGYIADAQREMADLGASSDATADLLRASAKIALAELPQVLSELQHAARRWEEQDLLDPTAAAVTLREIDVGLARINAHLSELHARHADLADEVKRHLDRAQGR